jgi:hypothetical protein
VHVVVIALTLLAAIAVAAWIVTFAVLLRERRRSDARVAALADAIDERAAGSARGIAVAPLAGHQHWLRTSGLPLNPSLAVAAGLGFGVTLVTLLFAFAGWDDEAAATASHGGDDATLELLSMSHVREGDALIITGLVRDIGPVSAREVTAVVVALNSGDEVSGRTGTPLEISSSVPGNYRPFRVTIPDVPGVVRYRVSFRTSEGPVRHIDRRTNEHGPRVE